MSGRQSAPASAMPVPTPARASRPSARAGPGRGRGARGTTPTAKTSTQALATPASEAQHEPRAQARGAWPIASVVAATDGDESGAHARRRRTATSSPTTSAPTQVAKVVRRREPAALAIETRRRLSCIIGRIGVNAKRPMPMATASATRPASATASADCRAGGVAITSALAREAPRRARGLHERCAAASARKNRKPAPVAKDSSMSVSPMW